ncbi:MAG: nuclear transport factor 2 family protein [Acidobacteriota bacterium]
MLLIAAGCGTPASAPAIDEESVESGVLAVLMEQVGAWNAGDIEGFMKGYWNSPELRFASEGSVREGWQETLDRYRQTYPDRATMGQLRFDEIDVRALAADKALVLGRWRLQREADEPNGLFTLILEVKDGEWRVVHDHTSSAPVPVVDAGDESPATETQ